MKIAFPTLALIVPLLSHAQPTPITHESFVVSREEVVRMALAKFDKGATLAGGKQTRPVEVEVNQESGTLLGPKVDFRDVSQSKVEAWRRSLIGRPIWAVRVWALRTHGDGVYSRVWAFSVYIDGATGEDVTVPK